MTPDELEREYVTLRQQSEAVKTFLLHSSVLDQMCGPLCDAVLPNSAVSGQDALAYLQRANLFLIPLDNERRWYRYHHLFADVLRQRAGNSLGRESVTDLHARASVWYETNGYEAEAFHLLGLGVRHDACAHLTIEGRMAGAEPGASGAGASGGAG